jgi:hypothetical protein
MGPPRYSKIHGIKLVYVKPESPRSIAKREQREYSEWINTLPHGQYVDDYGNEYLYSFGNLHSSRNMPSEKKTDGTLRWHKDGKLNSYRIYLFGALQPAEITANGTRRWYRDGVLHRENGPAEITFDGTKKWYRDGILHRENGPAEITADGTKKWYRDGIIQVAELPNGDKIYYENGEFVGCDKEPKPPEGCNIECSGLTRYRDGTQNCNIHSKGFTMAKVPTKSARKITT